MVSDDMHESLVSSSSIPLYDPVCMLDINRDVASGYLVLLMGGQGDISASPQKKRRGKRDRSVKAQPDLDNDVLSLAFLALTNGNVLNACFGAPTQMCVTSSPAFVMAKNAKGELANAAESSDWVRTLAVQSYAQGFRVVLDYNNQMAQMNPCSRCWKEAELRRQAEQDLKIAFRPLSEAVSDAS